MNPPKKRSQHAHLDRTGRVEGAPLWNRRQKGPEYGPKHPRDEHSETRKRDKVRIPPLLPILYRKANGTRYVVVTEGRVSEVVPRDQDGVEEREIQDLWDGKIPKEHGPIATNEYVGIAWTTNEFGDPTSDFTVAIRADKTSLHFQPPVGLSPGAPGDCFYILAQLTGSGDDERLEIWHGGSNIDYVHDTPPFLLSSGDATADPPIPPASGIDIFKQYNLLLGIYEYFGLKADYPIKVDYDGEDIKWEWIGEGNLNLTVKKRTLVPGDPVEVPISFTIPAQYLNTDAGTAHAHTVDGTVGDGGAHTPAFTGTLSIASDTGDHAHALGLHYHTQDGGDDTDPGVMSTGGGAQTFTSTGDYNGSAFVDDGSHGHTIDTSALAMTPVPAHTHPFTSSGSGSESDHTHPFTIPETVVNTTVEIPTMPVWVTAEDYFVICFRSKLYAGIVEMPGGTLPDVTDGAPLDEKTIYTINDDVSQADFSDPANSQLIPAIL